MFKGNIKDHQEHFEQAGMPCKSAAFYNNFSFFYPVVDIFLIAQKKVLMSEVNALPEGNLLEIGVGNGKHLRKYNRHNIIGIDTSASMLRIARKQACPGIQLVQMNGMALSYEDGSFDYVVLSHVIAVVDDAEKLMQEVLRVLRPGGRAYILNHFTPNNWLRHLDKAFNVAAKALHFKSTFHIQTIETLKNFTLLREVSFSAVSYFKLLVYQKNEK